MRNVCLSAFVFLFIFSGFTAGAKNRDCQIELLNQMYEEYGMPYDYPPEDDDKPGYSNSYEQDRRHLEPGPDEGEDDRNPDERDALDPGGF